MILEFYILKTRPRRLIIFAVLIMIFGAIVAASNDLAFDLTAYCFILANDLFTAANGVYTKNSLNRSDIGKYGLIFYNSLFSLPAVFVLVYVNGYGISHTTKRRGQVTAEHSVVAWPWLIVRVVQAENEILKEAKNAEKSLF